MERPVAGKRRARFKAIRKMLGSSKHKRADSKSDSKTLGTSVGTPLSDLNTTLTRSHSEEPGDSYQDIHIAEVVDEYNRTKEYTVEVDHETEEVSSEHPLPPKNVLNESNDSSLLLFVDEPEVKSTAIKKSAAMLGSENEGLEVFFSPEQRPTSDDAEEVQQGLFLSFSRMNVKDRSDDKLVLSAGADWEPILPVATFGPVQGEDGSYNEVPVTEISFPTQFSTDDERIVDDTRDVLSSGDPEKKGANGGAVAENTDSTAAPIAAEDSQDKMLDVSFDTLPWITDAEVQPEVNEIPDPPLQLSPTSDSSVELNRLSPNAAAPIPVAQATTATDGEPLRNVHHPSLGQKFTPSKAAPKMLRAFKAISASSSPPDKFDGDDLSVIEHNSDVEASTQERPAKIVSNEPPPPPPAAPKAGTPPSGSFDLELIQLTQHQQEFKAEELLPNGETKIVDLSALERSRSSGGVEEKKEEVEDLGGRFTAPDDNQYHAFPSPDRVAAAKARLERVGLEMKLPPEEGLTTNLAGALNTSLETHDTVAVPLNSEPLSVHSDLTEATLHLEQGALLSRCRHSCDDGKNLRSWSFDSEIELETATEEPEHHPYGLDCTGVFSSLPEKAKVSPATMRRMRSHATRTYSEASKAVEKLIRNGSSLVQTAMSQR